MPYKDLIARAAYRKQLAARPDQQEKARVRARAWYQKNRKRALEYQRKFRASHPEHYRAAVRIASRKYLYGEITRPEPEHCEACGIHFSSTKKGSCVDHDHSTGKFRGWLCSSCNLALGHLEDSKDRIARLLHYAVKYL